MTTPRIFLGMPGYGKQTAAAGRALWRASRLPVCTEYAAGSLLACNFNKLWCSALNMTHRGDQLEYFAMLHDDIGCEDFWLDTLIGELEDKQLDVLGVVVPIKDTRGITSIAVHHPGDNWNPACRLSMRDVFSLPETFTSDDLGGRQILLNTGCWVAKWNQQWCRQVHFEINDRIVFDVRQDCYRPEVESEDWFFSRLLHELDLKIGATRKIAVKHEGDVEFSNTFPWGSLAFDSESRESISPVPNAFPFDVEGWLLPDEGLALADLCRGKDVLEIGSYCGLSTICIARTARHVTSVDYFDGRGTPNPRETLDSFWANLRRYQIADRVDAINPEDMSLIDREYDIAFIDGAHDYQSVSTDIEKAQKVLRPGGLLVFHDYRNPGDPGVDKAVDELLLMGGELLSVTNTIAVVRPAAFVTLEV